MKSTRVLHRFWVFWISFGSPLLFVSATDSFANPCIDARGAKIPIQDDKILEWKRTTPNQTMIHSHVKGQVVKIYPAQTGHDHFSIKIGPKITDTIEVIYSRDFGPLPELRIGDSVEACGDYITANAPAGKYPVSPDGAIIHWVHASSGGHPDGFVEVNGRVFGTFSGSGAEAPVPKIVSAKKLAVPTCPDSEDLREIAKLRDDLAAYRKSATGTPGRPGPSWRNFPKFTLRLRMGKANPLADPLAQAILKLDPSVGCSNTSTELTCRFGIHKSGRGRFAELDALEPLVREELASARARAKAACPDTAVQFEGPKNPSNGTVSGI